MAANTTTKSGRGVLRGELPTSPDAGLDLNFTPTDVAEAMSSWDNHSLEFVAAQAEMALEARSPRGTGSEEFRAAKRSAREASAEMAGRVSVSHERVLGALEAMLGDDADIRYIGPEVVTRYGQDLTENKSHLVARGSRWGKKVSVKLTSTVWSDAPYSRKETRHRIPVFRPWRKTVVISAESTEEMISALALWAAQERAAG